MPDFHEKNADKIVQRMEHFAEALYEMSHEKDGIEIMQWVIEQVDKVITQPEFERFTSCKRGCNFCCHDNIILSEFEADYLKHILRGKFRPNKRRLKIQKKAKDFMKLPWAMRGCSLLNKNGECTIYENRPLVCKLHNSTGDPIQCKVDLTGKSGEHGQLYSLDAEALQMALLMVSGNKFKSLHEIL